MTQEELIEIHTKLAADVGKADDYRRGHYDHLLLSLKVVIEMHGPTPAYYAWRDQANFSQYMLPTWPPEELT